MFPHIYFRHISDMANGTDSPLPPQTISIALTIHSATLQLATANANLKTQHFAYALCEVGIASGA